ncbi:MAG: hypothetical protein P1V20_32495, partial [Verrucomicrobiales bacterium]|nr:hypothetical protein [Verrucomicrobiales bacterium]
MSGHHSKRWLHGAEPSLQYDKGNNRATQTVSGAASGNGITSYDYGDGTNGFSANQLKAITRPDNSQVTYTYDADGNRVTRLEGGQTDTSSYDYNNRLIDLDYQSNADAGLNGNYQYTYDYRTRRLARDEKGTITDVIYSGGVSVQEKDRTSGAVEVEFVRAPGLGEGGPVRSLLYSNRGGLINVSAMNARGDVTGKINAAGVLSYEAAYEAFGGIEAEAGTTEDRQKANTKEQDPHGLINDGFRYRDAETGVFLTRDPAGFVDGPNLYTYVRQNPWTAFDPLGLDLKVDRKKKQIEDSGKKKDVTVTEIEFNAVLIDRSKGVRTDSGYRKRTKEELLQIKKGIGSGIAEQFNKKNIKDGDGKEEIVVTGNITPVMSAREIKDDRLHIIELVNEVPNEKGLNVVGRAPIGGKKISMEAD